MRTKVNDQNLISNISEFMKTYLPIIKRRDPDTIESYRISMNLYLLYLEETFGKTLKKVMISDFNQKNIVAFMQWLSDKRNNAAPTINHRLSDIRSFCHYLQRKGLIEPWEYELIREIEDVVDTRIPDFIWLSVDDVKCILENTSGPRDAMRNHFLLSVLYESGARIDEVLSLTLNCFKPTSDGEVDVTFYGKGNKYRVTPLSSEIWNQYNKYCGKYQSDSGPNELLFYTINKGSKEKMSQDNIRRILTNIECSVKKSRPSLPHLHAHLFRTTRAMHLFEAGVPLVTISEWLGHSRIETTRFYAKVTTEMKRDAAKKLGDEKQSVFNNDVAFKYANDDAVLKKLIGL